MQFSERITSIAHMIYPCYLRRNVRKKYTQGNKNVEAAKSKLYGCCVSHSLTPQCRRPKPTITKRPGTFLSIRPTLLQEVFPPRPSAPIRDFRKPPYQKGVFLRCRAHKYPLLPLLTHPLSVKHQLPLPRQPSSSRRRTQAPQGNPSGQPRVPRGRHVSITIPVAAVRYPILPRSSRALTVFSAKLGFASAALRQHDD